MKTPKQQCDPNRISDYLEDRLAPEALDDLQEHLERCEACQVEITRRAAEPEFWDETAGLLGQTDKQAVDGDETEIYAAPARRSLEVSTVIDSLAPSDDPQMLGRLGEYEIRGVVGVGGMGAVLKGFDRSLLRVVAIKVMAPSLANSGSARTRFEREARAAAAITHNNVIDIYRVTEANGLPYLVMPFARGPSLQRRIDEGGPLSAIEVARIGRQIAAGLSAAHEQGLVHRDIKPANILLNDGIERVLITDFGVARAIDDASMTQTGLIAGTPQYMSPEQARGESVDCRSDLFSMGAVLYTACTGRPPFRADAAYGILRRITDTEPRPIREINPSVPDWLCNVISRLMAKHPSDRFQSAAEVAQILETCLAHLNQPTQIAIPDSLTRQSNHGPISDSQVNPSQPSFANKPRTGIKIMIASLLLIASTMLALQVTSPPEIEGQWQGEQWNNIELATVAEASHWFSGKIGDDQGNAGALHLEWSRLQRRYNGRWTLGEDLTGAITLRRTQDGLRGAISLDAQAVAPEGEPRLREFFWKPGKGTIAVSSIKKHRERKSSDGTAFGDQQTRDEFSTRRRNETLRTSDLDRAKAFGQTSVQGNSVVEGIGEMFGPASVLSERIVSAKSKMAELEVAMVNARNRLEQSERRFQIAKEKLPESEQKEEEIERFKKLYQRSIDAVKLNFVTTAQEFEQAKQQFSAVENERKTILDMLNRERDTLNKRLEQENKLLEQAIMRISLGDLEQRHRLHFEMNRDATSGRLQQLNLLIEFYSKMGETSGNDQRDSFRSPDPRGNAEKQLEVKSAQNNLRIKQIEAKLAAAEAVYQQRRLNYERSAKLHEKSFVSEAELEAEKTKMKVAQSTVEQIKAELEMLRLND